MPDSREVLTRPAPPPDRTLPYGPLADQVIDVRLPRRLPAPVIVVIHGGFWRQAYDRTHTGPMATALAAAGYVVAVPEYRRTGWPGTLDDAASALDAVPGLLAPYGSGPPVWLGHSAGGQLALWAAAREGAPTSGVVSLAGCADLGMCADLGLGGAATVAFLGGTPTEVPDRYALADPVRLPPPATPVTLLHGTADEQVPIEVSRSYAARFGAPLRELPAADHFALIDPLSTAWPSVLAALPSGS